MTRRVTARSKCQCFTTDKYVPLDMSPLNYRRCHPLSLFHYFLAFLLLRGKHRKKENAKNHLGKEDPSTILAQKKRTEGRISFGNVGCWSQSVCLWCHFKIRHMFPLWVQNSNLVSVMVKSQICQCLVNLILVRLD